MNIDYKNTLIDIISKYECSVNCFIYADKVDVYSNFDFKEFNQATMKKLIFNLLDDGLCDVFCWKNDEKVIITQQAIIDYQNTQSFNFDRADGICLSKQGGQVWENHFQPNWNCYVDVIYDDKDYKNPVNIEFISLNENLLKEICKDLTQEKFQIELLDEWEICYWKTINNQSIFKYHYIAKTLKEKILVDEIWGNLSKYYRNKFCPKSQHFY